MKKLFYVLIVPLLLLAGCTTTNTSSSETTSEVPTTSEVKPTSIEITSPSSQTTILVGETLQLNAAVSPSGASQSVTWSSSSDALATVSNNGLVTAVAPGNVIITAKSVIDTNISGEYALIVEEAPVVEVPPTSITVTGETTVKVGETISLSISVLPENAVDTVTWATSNEEIASVSNRGVVKGMAEGSVTITATSTLDTNVKGTLNVSVEEADIPDPTIDWETVEYTTHDEFVNMEADAPVKVKGVVTAVSNVKDNQINYYIQNGTEGFYVYAQNATYYPVEVGKSYEIGGFYKYYFTGTHEVVDVEYFKVLEEDIVAEINDLSEVNIAALDETTPLYGSLVKGEKFVVKSPILGFEEVNEVEFAEVDNGALAFLSMIGNDAELLLINPYKVREYSFDVPANIQALLDIKADSNVKVFCVFVREKQTEIRINFLAPIILNCDNHTLAQVILNAKDYPRFGVAESIKDYIKE